MSSCLLLDFYFTVKQKFQLHFVTLNFMKFLPKLFRNDKICKLLDENDYSKKSENYINCFALQEIWRL